MGGLSLMLKRPPCGAAVAIALISVWWILRQLGLPKIRARLHDGWWVLEVFMSMTVFGALIYSGFSFMVCRRAATAATATQPSHGRTCSAPGGSHERRTRRRPAPNF